MYRIIYKRKISYIFSSVIILAGVSVWALFGLRLGIDFTGGSLIEYSMPESVTSQLIQDVFKNEGFEISTIQETGANDVQIKLRQISADEHARISQALSESYEGVVELSFSTIGPTIGKEVKQKAVTATILVFLMIVFYVSWSFRKSAYGPVKSWVLGLSALIALFHDLLIVLSVFTVLGKLFNVEIDTLFVTALLTVLGFSVHDTIVVFDRVREQLRSQRIGQTFEDVVNQSVSQTLVRSLATSLTTILVLITLLLFGGASIRYFVVALIIGMIAGTYSSIFIASPLLVSWYNFKNK